jgi:hypothetical protein
MLDNSALLTELLYSGIILRRTGVLGVKFDVTIEVTIDATTLMTENNNTKQDVKAQLAPRERWANLILPLQSVITIGLGIAEVSTISFYFTKRKSQLSL